MKISKTIKLALASFVFFFFFWRALIPFLYLKAPSSPLGYNGLALLYALGMAFGVFFIGKYFFTKQQG